MNDLWQSAPLAIHPLADIFPMLGDDELDELAADIKQNGLLHPIVRTTDGKMIVDGRNRAEACRRAGVEPRYDDYISNDDEARTLIVSSNLARRHMTKAQQAMAHAMIYPEAEKGGRGKRSGNASVSEGFSAARLSQARTVLRYSDELAQEVLADRMPLDKAYDKATEIERAKRKEQDAITRLREVAPDLAHRVDAKDIAIDEAWTLHNKRDEAARTTREGVFNAWRALGEATRWIALTPSVLQLPDWLETEEYDSEFRQYFKGGVPELIKSLEQISAAQVVATHLIDVLNNRRTKR